MGASFSQTRRHFSTPAYSGGREGISCSHQILGVVYHRSRSVHCPSPFGNLLLSRASLHIMQVKPSGFAPGCQNVTGLCSNFRHQTLRKGKSLERAKKTKFLLTPSMMNDNSKLSDHEKMIQFHSSISSITAVITSALNRCFLEEI